MSAPTSGSSGSSSSSSSPATPSGSASGAPAPGYYPDPSIPNYIRYWDGSGWVPGTSRPAPPMGEGVVTPRTPALDESGPMFLDEDPAAPTAEQGPAGYSEPAPGPDRSPAVYGEPAPGPASPPAGASGPAAQGPTWPDPQQSPQLPRLSWGTPPPGERWQPARQDELPDGQGGVSAWPAAQEQRSPAPRPGGATGPQDQLPSRQGRLPGPQGELPDGRGASAGWPQAQQGQVPAQQSRPAAQQPQPQPQPQPLPPSPVPPQALPPQSVPGQPFGGAQPQPPHGPQPPLQPQPQPQPPSQVQPQLPPQSQPLMGPRPVAPQVPAQGQGIGGPLPGPEQPLPWAAQVQDLARGEGGVAPWKPVPSDPFGALRGHDRPGGLARRFAARLIDGVLLAGLTGLAAVPLGAAAYHHAQDKVDQARLTGATVRVWLIDGTTGAQLGAVLAVFLVAGLLLEVLPTTKWGRTAGKKLTGLKVLDIEGQLPPSFGASLRRWLTQNVLNLVAVGVVGLAWCLFDRPWKQCWHDKAARTFVAQE